MDRTIDLKGKFRTFVRDSRQKLLSPGSQPGGEGDGLQLLPPCHGGSGRLDRAGWTDSDREVSQLRGDPLADQEVLDSLDSVYFAEDSDPSLHCLGLLGDRLAEVDVIDENRKRLMQQLTTVSRRVFSLILEKQGDCGRQLEEMVQVQADLQGGLSTCRAGREGLGRAQRQFVNCSLGILARWRRRQQALQLLSKLETIRTLSLTQERLQELLAEEAYPQAISVLLECTRVAASFRHFAAINQLSGKLADTLVMTEEQLDLALAKQCTAFNPETYGRLQEAYSLLGNTQTSTDQVLMHFTTAIHNHSWAVVYGHVCLMGPCPRPPPYPELCRAVAVASFLPALTDLLRALWAVMRSYHQLVHWHRGRWRAEEAGGEAAEAVRQYCRNKLEAGVARVWQDVQTKVQQYVLASDLSQFTIENFLHFLDLLHRLIMVGQEFSGTSSSALLQDSLVTQCRAYFSAYHATRLEELKVHLENEGWTVCPVKQDFSFRLLAEFAHLSTLKSPTKSLTGSGSWLKRFGGVGSEESPFDELCQESLEEEDILETVGAAEDSEEELSPEQLQELLEENQDSGRPVTGLAAPSHPRPPAARATGLAVSNTAIMLLRLVGRYNHMMKVLAPIADTVWRGVCQLIEYFLYTCNQFFASDLAEWDRSVYTARLAAALAATAAGLEGEGGPGAARLQPGVLEAGEPGLLAGLPQRLVAVESGVFLAEQLRGLLPYLASSLGPEQAAGLDSFYAGTVAAAADLREPVYLAAVSASINTEVLLAMMGRVAWDIREVSTQHSAYVDHWLRELALFSGRLAKVATMVTVTPALGLLLWRQAVRVATNCFVEGFAGARRCTNEGRALMQLDFRQFVIQAEKLSGLKPLPFQELVTVYVKAYYIQETELEEWVGQHPEYTAAQLRAVVTAVTNNNSKTKQKLNSLINDLSGRIRR